MRTYLDGVMRELSQEETAAWHAVQEAETEPHLAAMLRPQRDALLAASDWRVLADAPGPREAWLKYRAELRAVPAQKGFPHQVAWPEPPA